MNANTGVVDYRISVLPEYLSKHPILKQSNISNLLFKMVLSRFGLIHFGSYLKTTKKWPEITYPYMNERISEHTYLYDFHSHSQYSDGKGDFKQILQQVAIKKHLNGLAFTDHPWHLDDKRNRILDSKVILRSYKAHELAQSMKRQGKLPESFITFPGSCEFFVNLSEDRPIAQIELIGLGLPQDFIEQNGSLHKITQMIAQEFIELAHENNGLVIIAHPFYFNRAYEFLKLKKLSRNATPDAYEAYNYITGFLYDKFTQHYLKNVDNVGKVLLFLSKVLGYANWMARIVGYENPYGKEFDYPLARKIAKVGNSDAHFLSMIGAGSTISRTPVESLEDLRNLFKNKRTIPSINYKWNYSTSQKEILSEVLREYVPKINEFIISSNKRSPNRILMLKLFLEIFSTLFEQLIF